MKKLFQQNVNPIPEFCIALSIMLDPNTDLGVILNDIRKLGIEVTNVISPKHAEYICLSITIVKNEHFWELNDALTKMFEQIDNCMLQLKSLIIQYCGKICVDVVFYQHGTLPALFISSENTKKVAYLDAEISIDPY